MQSKNEARKRISVVHTTSVREKTLLYGCRRISNSQEAAALGRKITDDWDKEVLVVCCLTSAMQPVSLEIVAIGVLDQCLVGMREVFRYAVLSHAAGIIVFHNHPSGDPALSMEDIKISEQMKKAGELLGITVHDHIVLGDDDTFTSVAETIWNKN